MIFAYARFDGTDLLISRLGGPGLANLLFAYARAVTTAKRMGWCIVRPTWPQIKIGPLLRGEFDSRSYVNLMKILPDELVGVARVHRLLFSRRIAEQSLNDPERVAGDRDVVIFSGMDNWFEPFLTDFSFLHARLRDSCRQFAPANSLGVPIGMHVRLGDFRASSDPDGDLRRGRSNIRLPLRWYVRALEHLRSQIGLNAKCWVFSDGTDGELAGLLSMPNVHRVKNNNALSDMLHLASCDHIIGSNSTYSMWAAYLAQANSYWYPGTLKARVSIDQSRSIELEF